MKKSKTIKYQMIELEFDPVTKNKLIEIGLKLIKKDPQELLNYAVNRILTERMEIEKNVRQSKIRT